MEIRDATAGEVPRIVELLAQMTAPRVPGRELAGTDATYAHAFAEIVADRRQRIFVVIDDGKVIGTANLVVVPSLSHGGRPFALLKSVVVDEAFRGRGIGARLVRSCVDEAKRAGCYRVQLTTLVGREPAQRFYLRLGFMRSHVGFTIGLE